MCKDTERGREGRAVAREGTERGGVREKELRKRVRQKDEKKKEKKHKLS